MKKIASILTISTTLIPLITNAECVPVPDCASIGYTETSCDGDSIKCPFDTTKLKCIPCDSSILAKEKISKIQLARLATTNTPLANV